MDHLQGKKKMEQWMTLLQEGRQELLISALEEVPAVEIAEFFQGLQAEEQLEVLKLFSLEWQADLFSHLAEHHQLELYSRLSPRTFARLFVHLHSDSRADFYQKLSKQEQVELLPFLPKQVRQDVITLSAYPPETVGGVMHTDFATATEDMTVLQALQQIRKDAPSKKMMYYLYVVDEEMRMRGIVSLKDLLMNEEDTPVRDIQLDTFIFALVDEDREEAAHKIEKYDLIAIPVLNHEAQLVGIVGYDDAMDVIRAEQTEDMERFMGIVHQENAEDYLHTSSLQHLKRRVGWIVGLFVAGFPTALFLHRYDTILKSLNLLIYVPSINDVGGNAGSQAATVVIRALSLGQISLKDWCKILWKEAKVGLMFFIPLFFLGLLKVWLFSGLFPHLLGTSEEGHLPQEGLAGLAMVVALALGCQICSATLIGAALPIFIRWLGYDPALAASPAITTFVDLTGAVIYVAIASLCLTPGAAAIG